MMSRMDRKTKKAVVIAVINTALVVSGLFLLASSLAPAPSSAPAPALPPPPSAPSDAIAVGNPCDVRGGTAIDTKGLQCYWYGEAPDRRGVWIKPDIRPRILGAYMDYFTRWNYYRTPDGSVYFEYPKTWKVHADAWKTDHRLDIGGARTMQDSPSWIQIETRDATYVPMEVAIRQIGANASSTLRTPVTLNGVNALRIDAAAKDTLSSDDVYLFVPRDKGYVYVHASRYHDPYYDFPIEAVLQSIKVR